MSMHFGGCSARFCGQVSYSGVVGMQWYWEASGVVWQLFSYVEAFGRCGVASYSGVVDVH